MEDFPQLEKLIVLWFNSCFCEIWDGRWIWNVETWSKSIARIEQKMFFKSKVQRADLKNIFSCYLVIVVLNFGRAERAASKRYALDLKTVQEGEKEEVRRTRRV
jgi:hypothetical protein